jgi:hypothetical protein
LNADDIDDTDEAVLWVFCARYQLSCTSVPFNVAAVGIGEVVNYTVY